MPYNLTTTSFGETGEISDRSSRSQRVLRHQRILNKMLVAPQVDTAKSANHSDNLRRSTRERKPPSWMADYVPS
ncbi:hypothetical protein EB796_011914 [Bugula neritina]|uniref:Uncharacterized protein n=1 Tax=Bugula neritina TaxID=10212 RepID=A0A7J7JWS9_BUGNE|nr:hypothetical protein EB796_011914 [Bugula neritina]